MPDTQRNPPEERDLAGHEEADVKHREEMLDEALEQTFPASDPISLSLGDVHHLEGSTPADRRTSSQKT